jgi:hypothetical protein
MVPGLLLVFGCGAPIAVGHVQAASQLRVQHVTDVRIDQQLQRARELPASPPDVVVALVEFIGEGGIDATRAACLMFSSAATAELISALNANSCPTAIGYLHSEVTDPGRYINAITVPPTAWQANADSATVDGCGVNWDGLLNSAPPIRPGPFPGRLMLARQNNWGWLITAYQAC